MKNFIRHFQRVAPGVWMCLEPAELQLPGGRVQVTPGTQFTIGTKFMNIELAAHAGGRVQAPAAAPLSKAFRRY